MSDLISRQALRDALEKCECTFDGGYDMNDVDAIIAYLPSTDHTGHWEAKEDDVFATEYYCSNCGSRAEVDLYGQWILSDFCPNCGADMKGADDETD